LVADQHDGEGELAVESGETGECAFGDLLAVAQGLLLDVQLGMIYLLRLTLIKPHNLHGRIMTIRVSEKSDDFSGRALQ
jgi:hypothetical protein